ncbi:MAG: SagB family peptide dehydrogenase, partial [Acidobacteriota bacterium]
MKLPKGDGVCGLSLTEALESRRSLYSTAPLSLDQLGEFLYRTSRITGTLDAGSETLLRRPYPSGGGFHSLEAYIVATRCKGLEPGMYHYRPLEHGLVSIASPGPRVEKLLEEARIGTGRLDRAPSVLIVLAARFRRVSRKYRGLVYSLILKEVGAAFQTFYLVATEMGLAPCAIGTGNSEAFCQAAGVEFFQESSVGEFILGGAEP